MALETGTLAKGAAALLLLGGGGAGAYYGYNHLYGQSKTVQPPAQESSRYDDALITFLNTDGNDIVFDVKKVSGDKNTDDFKVGDLTLNHDGASAQVEAKIAVPADAATSANLKAGAQNASGDQLKALKEAGKDKSWTWSCILEFKKTSEAKLATLKEANRILKTGDTGLLGILKKDLHSYKEPTPPEGTKWKKADLKKAKEDFITLCAKERKFKNKAIDESAEPCDQLKVTKTFALSDEAGDAAGRKLIAGSDSKFNEWFKADYGTKAYSA